MHLEKKELLTVSYSLNLLSEAIDQYYNSGKINVKTKNSLSSYIKEILRFGQSKANELLSPAQSNNMFSIIAEFLDAFANVLREYASDGKISVNFQTSLKAKLKELVKIQKK